MIEKQDRRYVSKNAKVVSITSSNNRLIPAFEVRYCVDTKQGLIYATKRFWVADELQAYQAFEKLRMGERGEIPNGKEI